MCNGKASIRFKGLPGKKYDFLKYYTRNSQRTTTRVYYTEDRSIFEYRVDLTGVNWQKVPSLSSGGQLKLPGNPSSSFWDLMHVQCDFGYQAPLSDDHARFQVTHMVSCGFSPKIAHFYTVMVMRRLLIRCERNSKERPQ
jgi:hypothetical protein